MKKNRVSRLMLIAIVLLGIAGTVYLLRPIPLEVETARVDCGPMQVTVSAEGRTRVRERFVVSTPVDGNLSRIEVKEGYPVKRGTILTYVMPSPLEARSLRQREASLQAAEADKQAAEAQAARARVEFNHATSDFKRISGLVAQGIRPRQDLDAAQAAESGARELLKAATSAVEVAAFHVEEIRSTLLTGSSHAIAVRSPVDGVVLRVTQQSERIVPSGTPVAEIGDAHLLELVFEVLSTDVVRVKRGASVIVQNWGGEGALPGRVRLIEPGAFTKVSALGVEEQRVNVIADFEGEFPPLGDGYRVEGDIVVWASDSAIQVPVSALFRNGPQWQVFVVENGQTAIRGVQIGHRNQKNAEVERGLTKGDVVVLYPDDRLTQGRVKAVARD